MNPKMQKLLLAATIITFGIGMGHAHAQTSDADPELQHHAYAFASFMASGIFYSASGWIKRVRRMLAGDSTERLDYSKMGKSLLIGVILGIGAFVWSSYEGDTIAVGTLHEFLTQVGINTSVILLVDKWILGRPEKQPTGAMIVLNEHDFEEEQDQTAPPGKGE